VSAPINDGGPAFPTYKHGVQENGATLRDMFAAHALTGCMTSAQGLGEISDESLKRACLQTARILYVMADAMLAAREASK